MKVYHSYYCSMVTEEGYNQLKFSYILQSIGQCLSSSLDYTALWSMPVNKKAGANPTSSSLLLICFIMEY